MMFPPAAGPSLFSRPQRVTLSDVSFNLLKLRSKEMCRRAEREITSGFDA
jgi:hypothetical protein